MRGNMKLRKSLREFAETQEGILKDKEHKGGWEVCTNFYLFQKLELELEELERALIEGIKTNIRKECADIANYAMMLADNNKGV